MLYKRKPFFKRKSDIPTKKQQWKLSDDTWSAIKELVGFKIEKRDEKIIDENPIYLFSIFFFSGLLYGLIIWVLLIGVAIGDKRTWLLFILVYFVYGIFSDIFSYIYFVPLAVSKSINLVGFIALFFLTNYVAQLLGFTFIQ